MPEAVLRLKRGRERPRVHPWIFKGDVADVAWAEPGAAVTVVDAGGRFVGRGFYNPRPTLCCRIATRVDEPLDAAFFQRRVAASARARAETGGDRPRGDAPSAARLVWSEADSLPGLVADRYGPVLAVQCLTLGMAQRRAVVAGALRAAVGDLPVFSCDEPASAGIEGFQAAFGWLDRPGPESLIVEEGAARFEVRFGAGHKTGLYLDQAENRRRVALLADGREVLDAFAYTAGFACHALLGGARRALCLESSRDALAGARRNLELNGVAERAELRDGNAFDELRRLERDGARFGLIVLDPPPFARSRAALEAALRGYKEINLRAMRLLDRGGRLLTFSCSHLVTEALFEEMCRDAASDVGVTLKVLASLTQAADHPVLLTVPETRYLKGLLLEAC